jgi:hypothetical protein
MSGYSELLIQTPRFTVAVNASANVHPFFIPTETPAGVGREPCSS